MMNFNSISKQYQMSEELYYALLNHLNNEGITVKQLCQRHNWDYFMFSQIMDRKVKMHSSLSFLQDIPFKCGLYVKEVGADQPTRLTRTARTSEHWMIKERYYFPNNKLLSAFKKYLSGKQFTVQRFIEWSGIPYYIVESFVGKNFPIQLLYLEKIANIINYSDKLVQKQR